MKYLNIILIAVLLLCSSIANGQDWKFTGNNPSLGDYLGTNTNTTLDIRTNNTQRAKLNPNVTYTTDGYSVARNGYLLLGYSQGFASSLFTSATQGRFLSCTLMALTVALCKTMATALGCKHQTHPKFASEHFPSLAREGRIDKVDWGELKVKGDEERCTTQNT